MMWLKVNMCVKKWIFKSKGGTTYDNLAPKWCGWLWMVGIDGNGRDGRGRREDISLIILLFSLLLFLVFFLLPFSLPLFFLTIFFFFFKYTSEFQQNLHRIRIWRSCFVEVWREFAKMWSVMFEGICTCERNVEEMWWMCESLGSVIIISEAENGCN